MARIPQAPAKKSRARPAPDREEMLLPELEIDVRDPIKKLALVTKELVSSSFVGNYKSAFKGKGLEFEGYREYSPTDDASLIDWKASVRSGGKLLVKEFVEERNLTVFFLVDSSDSMVFGSIVKLKHEYTAELVSSLAYAILQAGDGVGMAMYGDRVVATVPSQVGAKQFYAVLRQIAEPRNYGGQSNLEAGLKFAVSTLERGTLVIIVSDFLNPGGNWQSYLKTASRKFEVVGVMVRDARDRELPEGVGQIVLSDPTTGKQLLVDVDKVKGKYEAMAKAQEKDIHDVFLKSRADFLALSTSTPFIHDVVNFFRKRASRRS